MKRVLLGGVIALSLFTACKETETTFVDITGTGIIKGTVFADIEQADTKFDSETISGVTVRILWSSEGLGVISDGDDRTESLIVTTDSVGVYTAELPTTEDGVVFTVEFDELETELTYNNGATSVTTQVIFPESDYTITVRSGETKTQDHDYGSAPDTELESLATITGVVEVDSEQINTEDIPELASGATVTVKWTDGDTNERSISTTTDASGVYSVQVPTQDVDGDYTVVFEELEVEVDYNDGFRNVTGYSATFDENSDNDDISVDTGKEVTVNYNYGSGPKEALPTFGLIEGTLIARTNAIAGSEEDSPVPNVEVRITWTDDEGNTRGVFATTNAQGEYSAEVPLADTDDFSIRIEEFTVSYSYNNGSEDVTGATATYAEFNTSTNDLGKGEERTVDRTVTTPTSIED